MEEGGRRGRGSLFSVLLLSTHHVKALTLFIEVGAHKKNKIIDEFACHSKSERASVK